MNTKLLAFLLIAFVLGTLYGPQLRARLGV